MAPDPERTFATDDTLVVGQRDPTGDEEVTQMDDEWPVADIYYVQPEEPAPEAPVPDDGAATAVPTAEPTMRRLTPPFHVGPLLAAIAIALVFTLGAGALLVLLGADEPAASSTSPTGSLASEPPPDTSPSAPAELNVAVADVEGMPLPQARAALQDQGMRVRVTRSPSDRARGVVLDQEPTADSDVPKGTVIALFVSGGAKTAAERVEVPDVVGLSASRAVATLREAGLDARVRLVRSSGRPGVVVDQTPGTSSEVATSVVVQLEVTRPRPAVRVEVPDVVGSTAANARRELRAAGLTVMTVAVVSQEPAGTVIEQLPRAGSESRKGTAVKLTVSSGPAMVDVPDVTGLDEASARAELERAGFQVRVTDESTTDPLQDGTVLRQTPQGGSSAEEGAIVTITVARLD